MVTLMVSPHRAASRQGPLAVSYCVPSSPRATGPLVAAVHARSSSMRVNDTSGASLSAWVARTVTLSKVSARGRSAYTSWLRDA